MAEQTVVGVKQAVASAQAYLLDLFQTGGSLQLEEVEPLDGGWQITFSYERQEKDPYNVRSMIALQEGRSLRVYKVVTVDPSGEPQSVKMR